MSYNDDIMKHLFFSCTRRLFASSLALGVCVSSGETLTLDVQEGSQTFSSDMSADSLNKTGAGEAVVNAPSVVVSGRATSSAGVLKFTGSGTRTFGSLMADAGRLVFADAGDVSVDSVFVRSSSASAWLSLAGTTAINGSQTLQIAASAGTRGCVFVGDGARLSFSAFQAGESGQGHCVVEGGSVAVSGETTLSANGGAARIVAAGGSFVSAGTISVAATSSTADEETLIAAYDGGVVKSTGGDFAVKATFAHRTVVAACDGGVFGAQHLTKTASAASTLHLGFNGGVLAPTYPYNFFNNLEPDSLTVYEKGMTIDTSETKNGGNFGAVWLTKPIVGPKGSSIGEIALPTGAPFLSEVYSGPVPVVIAGTGVGAAAVAEYDAETHAITSIRVVCPGTGYDETTTASVRSEDGRATYSCPVTVVAAKNTGSLTKRGGAAYRLWGGNAYGGDTICEGGELVLWADDSLPATSGVICRDGATFNLNGKNDGSFAVPRLGGAGGTISGGNVTVTESLVFDGNEIAAASGPLQMTGSLTLGANVSVRLGRLRSLEPNVRYEVLHAAGGISGTPLSDRRCKVEVENGSIWLTRRASGLSVLVR